MSYHGRRVDDSRPRVLVLDGETTAALETVRSLGRRGFVVDVGSSANRPLAGLSRFARRSIGVPDPIRDDRGFRTGMVDLVKRGGYALVMPMSARTMVALSVMHEALGSGARVAMASPEAIAVMASVSALGSVVGRCGVPMPATWHLSADSDLDEVTRDIRYPAIVMPEARWVRMSDRRWRELPTWVTYSPLELRERTASLASWGPVVVQERPPGVPVELALLAGDGDTLCACQYRCPHEVPSGEWRSSYQVSEAVDRDLLRLASAIVKDLRVNGVVVMRFCVSESPRQAVLAQVTTDLSTLLPLATATGLDLPAHMFDFFVSGRREFPRAYAAGVGRREWSGEIEWLTMRVRTGTRATSNCDRSRRMRNRASPWRRVPAYGRRVVGGVSDPRPVLSSARQFGGLLLDKAWTRIVRASERRRMLRIRHRPAPLIRRVRHARRILFVCHGNVIRSAFAARYLLRALPESADGSVWSAGLGAHDGGMAHPRAVARARRWQVDLADHRTTSVNPELLASADLVLVMGLDHLATIRREYGHVHRRTFLLSCLAPDVSLEIDDPIGHGDAAFDACFGHIAKAVAPIVAVLRDEAGLGR